MTRKDDEEGSVEVWELPGPVRPTGRGGPETTRNYLKTHLFFIAWKFDTWPPRQGIHVQDVHGCPRKTYFCTICLRKLIIKLAFCSHEIREPSGHHDVVSAQGGLGRAASDAVSRVRKAGKRKTQQFK